MNDLAFIATGIYGKPIPNQNGAPLRLVVPFPAGGGTDAFARPMAAQFPKLTGTQDRKSVV